MVLVAPVILPALSAAPVASPVRFPTSRSESGRNTVSLELKRKRESHLRYSVKFRKPRTWHPALEAPFPDVIPRAEYPNSVLTCEDHRPKDRPELGYPEPRTASLQPLPLACCCNAAKRSSSLETSHTSQRPDQPRVPYERASCSAYLHLLSPVEAMRCAMRVEQRAVPQRSLKRVPSIPHS